MFTKFFNIGLALGALAGYVTWKTFLYYKKVCLNPDCLAESCLNNNLIPTALGKKMPKAPDKKPTGVAPSTKKSENLKTTQEKKNEPKENEVKDEKKLKKKKKTNGKNLPKKSKNKE